jgi:hypothetical protein
MPLDLSDADRKALAADVAEELDTGRYGDRFVLSRRQLLTIAGGSAGVAGLTALGVDPATAQSAAGQVGTESSPENVFAYDLDVQGALQRELDAGGQAITNAGSLSTDLTETTPTNGVFHQNNRLIQAYFDSSSLGSWGASDQFRLRFAFGTSLSTNRNFMIGIRLVKGGAFAARDAYVYKEWIGNLAGNTLGNVQSDVRFETRGASASVSDTANDHEIDLVVTDSDSTQAADEWTALVTAFAAPSSIAISQSVIEPI